MKKSNPPILPADPNVVSVGSFGMFHDLRMPEEIPFAPQIEVGFTYLYFCIRYAFWNRKQRA